MRSQEVSGWGIQQQLSAAVRSPEAAPPLPLASIATFSALGGYLSGESLGLFPP